MFKGLRLRTNANKNHDEMSRSEFTFNAMPEKREDPYIALEEKIEERTQMLREANEQLREKSQEMQRINVVLSDRERERSEFLATTSDGLRQPLGSIIDLSQRMLADQHNNDQDQYLRDILWNAQNLDDQLNNLRVMSKIEAGLMGLDCIEFKFEEVLRDIIKMMNPVFVRKNLKFSIDIATTTPPLVADYDKIKHVLRNLLSNSLKFTAEGGWVGVRIEPLPVAKDGREFVLIQISDSGMGIKDEDLPNIFSMMWQEKNSEQNDQGGLGLAIVKIFIELHGGFVDVKSAWQKGTLFSLKLPLRPKD